MLLTAFGAITALSLSIPPAPIPLRVAEADFEALRMGDPLPGALASLAPGAVLVARPTTGLGPPAWSFAQSSQPLSAGSSAIIAAVDGVLGGFIRESDGTRWRLRLGDDGTPIAELEDESSDLPCEGGIVAPDSLLGPPSAEGGVAGDEFCDDGSMIDVLVLYTPAARTAAGGTGSITALIAAAVASANSAYQKSQIAPRIQAIAVAEIAYTESSFGEDLSRLAGLGDGYLDVVHPLRDVSGADLVALIRTSGEYCGIAYLLPENSPSASGIGFSVTAWSCLSTYTLAHELGHNMGCCHALGDGGGCLAGGFYPYSLGWRFNGQGGTLFRTIMAYAPGARIEHFSNPAVNFDNAPTGVPINPATGEGAHNAETIESTSLSLANFRCSQPPLGTTDCDGDGVSDLFNIAEGRDSDCDHNGILDSCQLANVDSCGGGVLTMLCSGGVVQSVKAPSPETSDQFGRSVAIGRSFIAIGTAKSASGFSQAGQVEIFTLEAEHWTAAQSIVPPMPATLLQFGISCAAEEDLLAIGAIGTQVNSATFAGSVFVYRRDRGLFALAQQIDCPTAQQGDSFGKVLALRDGVLVVGAPGRDTGGLLSSGAAFVYRVDSRGVFQLESEIVAQIPGEFAGFGSAVAVAGNRVVVGAPFEVSGGNEKGAAYFFDGSPGGGPNSWTLAARFDGAALGGKPRFGNAVAIHDTMAVIGAPNDSSVSELAGSVTTIERVGGTWTASGITTFPGSPSSLTFGGRLALHGDRLLVGTTNTPTAVGFAYLHERANDEWVRYPLPYGGGVSALAQDLAVVGSQFSDEGPVDSGSARIIRFARDCDNDGLSDRCATMLGLVADQNNDGVPDSCQSQLGDLNGNLIVDGADLGILLAAWGPCPPPCASDFNGDGSVDGSDLGVLLANWTN